MDLKIATTRILQQLSTLINQLTENEFVDSLPVLNGATIGQHVRHTLEFFVCLEQGFHSGVVNYDNRAHDITIENDKHIALAKITEIEAFINVNHTNKALVLEMCYSTDEKEPHQIETSYLRELAYNLEHSVHHMAIVKIGVKAVVHNIELPEDFGVAVSTIRYRQQAEA